MCGWCSRGGQLDLALEPLRPESGRELRMEHFQSDWSIVPEIVREIHGGHATAPELPLKTVAVR